MSAGVASAIRSCRVNSPPKTAMIAEPSSAIVRVVPATALTFSGSPAPQA